MEIGHRRGVIRQFLTSRQGLLHLDRTEGGVGQRGQDAQLIRVKGDPQERRHDVEHQVPLLSETTSYSGDTQFIQPGPYTQLQFPPQTHTLFLISSILSDSHTHTQYVICK